jgi:hypothetical protein
MNSTDSGTIMNSISRALDHLLRATGDPIGELDDISPGSPGHLHAEVIRAAVGVLAKLPDALPAITRAAREADTPGISPRLRAHLEAARLWVQGDAILAAQRYTDIIDHWPRDLLAMRLALSCYFFVGQLERMCAPIDEVMKAWRRDSYEFGFMLAMASFAHAESGHADRAEQLGREALARDPACPMGVHAVVHAIAETGRRGAGARWMRAQRAHWAVASRMRTHNAWHLAMCDMDDGNMAPAISILDTCLLPAAESSPVDACDVTSLLWRLSRSGLDVGNRWLRLSDAFERQWHPGFWPYIDVHAALAHLLAARQQRADRLVRSVELCAAGSHPAGTRARDITLPLLRTINDWSRGDRRAAATTFSNQRALLAAAGGSRIQMEIFTGLQDEVESSRRAPLPASRRRVAGESDVDHYRQAH